MQCLRTSSLLFSPSYGTLKPYLPYQLMGKGIQYLFCVFYGCWCCYMYKIENYVQFKCINNNLIWNIIYKKASFIQNAFMILHSREVRSHSYSYLVTEVKLTNSRMCGFVVTRWGFFFRPHQAAEWYSAMRGPHRGQTRWTVEETV